MSLVLGGLGKVMDDFQNLDNNLKGCGKRQLCEAMSLGSQIARSDGTYGFQKGFLRHGVDASLGALFEVAKPFMEVFGMGSVARHEVSFTRFSAATTYYLLFSTISKEYSASLPNTFLYFIQSKYSIFLTTLLPGSWWTCSTPPSSP